MSDKQRKQQVREERRKRKRARRTRHMNRLLKFLIALLAVLFLGMFINLIYNNFYSFGIIHETSMEPTLQEEDIVVISKSDLGKRIKRFDIVSFLPPDGDKNFYVKRVIGLPGDDMYYQDSQLYINGKAINEYFLKGDDGKPVYETQNFTLMQILKRTPVYNEATIAGMNEIPEDMYLVLGDNRENSIDSRTFGLVNIENIEGILMIRVYPFEKVQRYADDLLKIDLKYS